MNSSCRIVGSVFLLLWLTQATVGEECQRGFLPKECLYSVSTFAPTPASEYLPQTLDSPGIFFFEGCPFHKAGRFQPVNVSGCTISPCPTGELHFKEFDRDGNTRLQLVTSELELCEEKIITDCFSEDIVTIMGDSMMRQLFTKLISIYRGSDIALDYSTHVHSVYRVCKEEDNFEYFGQPGTVLPTLAPTDVINKHLTLPRLKFCSRNPTVIYNFFAPTFYDQALSFRALLARSLKQHTLIVGVHYWEMSSAVPLFYLGALSDLAASLKHLIIVGVPTIRVSPTHEMGLTRQALQNRNAHLRNWVARQRLKGFNVSFLDYDYYARLPNAPVGDTGNNWHYQCYLIPSFMQNHQSTNSWRVTWKNTTVYNDLIRMQEDGMCYDDMNGALWAVIARSVCGER